MAEIWILPLPSVLGEGSRVLSSAVTLLALRGPRPARRRTRWPPPRGPGRLAGRVHAHPDLRAVLGPVRADRGGAVLRGPATATSGRLSARGAGRCRRLLFFDLRVPELGDPSEIVFHWMVCTVAFGARLRSSAPTSAAPSRAGRNAPCRPRVTSREQALRAVVRRARADRARAARHRRALGERDGRAGGRGREGVRRPRVRAQGTGVDPHHRHRRAGRDAPGRGADPGRRRAAPSCTRNRTSLACRGSCAEMDVPTTAARRGRRATAVRRGGARRPTVSCRRR